MLHWTLECHVSFWIIVFSGYMSRGWGLGIPSWVKLDFVVWCRLGKILYLSFRRVIHTLRLEKGHLFSDGRFLLLIYLFLPRWTLSYDCSRFVASILGLWQGCDDVFCVLSRCSTLACISSEDCRLVFRETTVSETVFAVLLGLPCVSRALTSYCLGSLVYPCRTQGVA